jgi:hypothetical protein
MQGHVLRHENTRGLECLFTNSFGRQVSNSQHVCRRHHTSAQAGRKPNPQGSGLFPRDLARKLALSKPIQYPMPLRQPKIPRAHGTQRMREYLLQPVTVTKAIAKALEPSHGTGKASAGIHFSI